MKNGAQVLEERVVLRTLPMDWKLKPITDEKRYEEVSTKFGT
jgi:hypothetical protein